MKSTDLNNAKMVWGTFKINYPARISEGKKVLMLDADIVFIGPFLETLKVDIFQNEWVVNSEEVGDPNDPYILDTYFTHGK